MMMDAVICDSPGHLALARKAIPERRTGEVLVRVRRVGICGTDMHIFRGTQPYLSYPRIMGHEVAGEVAEAPRDSRFKPGDQVCVMPYLSCGQCSACRKSRPNCCRNIEVLGVHRDGGLAEYLALPEAFVYSAEGVSLDQAAMIEFLAIGAHAVRRAKIEADCRVLIVGAGPIGIAAGLFAMLEGASVTALDSRQDRLDFCRDVLRTENIVTTDQHAAERLQQLTDGDLFDVVFDATGNRQAMEASFAYVGHAGSYVLLSIVNGDIAFSDPDFHRREMTLLSSRNATVSDFERVIQAIRRGEVPTHALNTHRATLTQFAEILPTWMNPAAGVIKAIVEC
jgi:2-desacetyl-2-hydroxyethyl bacteriochlorophyllide A dehydrogenase